MTFSCSAVAASSFFLSSAAWASIVFFSAARACSASFKRDSASFTRRSDSSAFIMTSSWRSSDLATSASALEISCWSARYASLVFTAPLWSRYFRARSFHSWPSNSNFLRSELILASASLAVATSARAPVNFVSASRRRFGKNSSSPRSKAIWWSTRCSSIRWGIAGCMERSFYHSALPDLTGSAGPRRRRIRAWRWVECKGLGRKETGFVRSKEEWNAACANNLGRGTYRGTKAKDCRARHGGFDRGRQSEKREHSRFVSRRSGDELRRSRHPRGGPKADTVIPFHV